MRRWPVAKAQRVLAAVLRRGWSIKRQTGGATGPTTFLHSMITKKSVHACWPGSPNTRASPLTISKLNFAHQEGKTGAVSDSNHSTIRRISTSGGANVCSHDKHFGDSIELTRLFCSEPCSSQCSKQRFELTDSHCCSFFAPNRIFRAEFGLTPSQRRARRY
jgi:hypothetical protein